MGGLFLRPINTRYDVTHDALCRDDGRPYFIAEIETSAVDSKHLCT